MAVVWSFGVLCAAPPPVSVRAKRQAAHQLVQLAHGGQQGKVVRRHRQRDLKLLQGLGRHLESVAGQATAAL
jgi:hypothetical protein